MAANLCQKKEQAKKHIDINIMDTTPKEYCFKKFSIDTSVFLPMLIFTQIHLNNDIWNN